MNLFKENIIAGGTTPSGAGSSGSIPPSPVANLPGIQSGSQMMPNIPASMQQLHQQQQMQQHQQLQVPQQQQMQQMQQIQQMQVDRRWICFLFCFYE